MIHGHGTIRLSRAAVTVAKRYTLNPTSNFNHKFATNIDLMFEPRSFFVKFATVAGDALSPGAWGVAAVGRGCGVNSARASVCVPTPSLVVAFRILHMADLWLSGSDEHPLRGFEMERIVLEHHYS